MTFNRRRRLIVEVPRLSLWTRMGSTADGPACGDVAGGGGDAASSTRALGERGRIGRRDSEQQRLHEASQRQRARDPTARPTITGFMPLPQDQQHDVRPLAPSAMRMPISVVCWLTV